ASARVRIWDVVLYWPLGAYESANVANPGRLIMPHQLRFGIITLQNAPWPTMVERWQHIEGLGFDSLWLADHFVNSYQPSQFWLEAWTLLSALAAQTSRIRIGTLVTPVGLRNPAVLARQALTVDHISNGRLAL